MEGPTKKALTCFTSSGTTGQTKMRDVGGKSGKSVAEEHDTSKNMTEEN